MSKGLIKSDVPGRTDRIPLAVPPDSYVIPADVIGILGQGNTDAGSALLDQALAPHDNQGMARGGHPGGNERVPIIAAGGEKIIPPHIVSSLGGGDAKKGFAVLAKMITNIRKREASALLHRAKPKN